MTASTDQPARYAMIPTERTIVEICIALRDIPRQKSALIGAFSTKAKARAACQEEADEDDETSGVPRTPLAWNGDTAELPDGDSYVVLLTSLNVRTGLG